MSESALQSAIIQLAELLDWRVYHVANVRRQLRASTSVGFPDLVLLRGTRLVFAELKSAKGKLTAEQKQWIAALGVAGVECYVWRPDDWHSGEVERALKAKRAMFR